jgi:hypothetical protein
MSEVAIDTKKLHRSKTILKWMGIMISGIGWLGIWGVTPFYLWIYANGLGQYFLDVMISDMILTLILSSIFVVLGNRIRAGVDRSIRMYLQVLIILMGIMSLGFIIFENTISITSWVYIGVLVFLICSWVVLSQILRNKDFVATLHKPVYKYFDTKGWVIFFLIAFGILSVTFFLDWSALEDEMYWDSLSEEEYSEETDNKLAAMVSILNDRPFPSKLNDNITLLGIKEQQSGSIHYTYEIKNIDSSQLSTEFLKDLMVKEYCSNEFVNYILDQEIDIAHSFTTEKGENYFVTLDFSSCESSSFNFL